MHSCMSTKLRHFIQTGQWHGHPFWATLYKHYTLLQVDSGIPISVNCFPILPSLVGSWHEEDTSLLGLSATKATSLGWNWHKWHSWQVTIFNVSYNKRGFSHAKYVCLITTVSTTVHCEGRPENSGKLEPSLHSPFFLLHLWSWVMLKRLGLEMWPGVMNEGNGMVEQERNRASKREQVRKRQSKGQW